MLGFRLPKKSEIEKILGNFRYYSTSLFFIKTLNWQAKKTKTFDWF